MTFLQKKTMRNLWQLEISPASVAGSSLTLQNNMNLFASHDDAP
jgi:hypothetical protein